MTPRSVLRPLLVVSSVFALYACGDDAKPAVGGGAVSNDCYPTAATCGVVASKCLAFADVSNTQLKTLRISQLKLTKPSSLASPTIAFTIIGPAVTIAEKPECYLSTKGKGGQFSWIMEFDLDKKTLKTGGAPPVSDPNAGYCYVDKSIAGTPVAPLFANIDYDPATGEFSTKYDEKNANITVPIFTDAAGMNTPILLPLRAKKDVPMLKGKFSQGGNCIGTFRGDQLKPSATKSDNCQTDSSDPKEDDAYQFKGAGALEGYITAEEADKVVIVDLGQTLCSFLSSRKNDVKCGEGKIDCCPRTSDGKLDLDTSSNKPDYDGDGDGSLESWVLGAELAASAVKINGACP